MATRVYHPTLNAWTDIDEADKASWKDAGWRLTRPDHVDDSEALPVGASLPAGVTTVTNTTGKAERIARAPKTDAKSA